MPNARPEDLGERVLVLAPTARDGAATCDLLTAAGVDCLVCGTIAEVCRAASRGAGAALMTAEAIVNDNDGYLAGLLHTQPPWSDLPLIVLTPVGADSPKLLRALEAVGPMTLMKRPVQVSTLVSTVRTALRDRRRQYAVRDLLAERDRAAATLRAERERYRVTLSSIGDAVIATDTEGRVTFLNPVAEAITGWDTEAARGRLLDEVFRIVNETTRQDVENPAVRALTEGVVVGLANHTVLIALDGTERPIDDSAAPIRGAGDEIVGAVLVFRDITERRRAEQAVRESDGRFRTLFDSMDEGFCVVEMLFDSAGAPVDYRFLEVNPAFEKQCGLRDATGKTMREFVPDHDAQWFKIYGKVAVTGEAVRFVNESTALNRWFNVYAFRLGSPDSRKVAILFTDITSWKRAQESLARDAMLLANVHDAVIMTDLAGVVTYWNDGATQLFGWSAAEMVGRLYADRFPEPERSWVAKEVQSRAAGNEWSGEYEDYRKDGSRVWIDARVTRINDAAGKLVGILGLSHDISERKRAEEALKEEARRKDEFLAMLAHELRNPLAPIRNSLQVMRLARDDRSVFDASRAMLERQVGHMVRLIDDLLDVSRFSRGKVELRTERLDLAAVLAAAVETSRPVIDAAGHELTISLSDRPVYLEADPTRLTQVIGNLLNNAAKYTESGGTIWLTATREGDEAVIRVRDTGVGIPAEMLPRVFDLFTQVDYSADRAKGGLGIGLTLVKSLVEMHGGTVGVVSPGRDRGSEFTVRLPALPASEPPDRVRGSVDMSAPTRCRVLVVDDNRDAATSLAMLLEIAGHDVRAVHDGPAALAAVEAERPDVVLLDLGMPEMNGYEVAGRLRARPDGTHLRLVALTGWGADDDRRRTREAGFDHHLVKPVATAELQSYLNTCAEID